MSMTARAETRTARERILDAAASLFARRGYYNANVDEIIQQSGTSKGSFYFHFPSKEQMALGLVDQLSEKLVGRLERSIASEPDPLKRIPLAIDALLSTFSKQRKLAQILLVNIVGQGRSMDRKFLPIRDKFAGLIRRELDSAVEAGAIRPVDTNLVSRLWLGALSEVILRWLLQDKLGPLMDSAPEIRELLMNGIGIEAGAGGASRVRERQPQETPP